MYPSGQHLSEETKNKEPWLAVNLSKLLPGAGQIYAGKPLKGYVILLSFVLLVGISGWLLLNPTSNILVGSIVLTFAGLILPIWNLFDAHSSAKSRNSGEFESERTQSKDAWLAVFLSGFIPGLGHAYLRKRLSSVLFFAVFIAVCIVGSSQNPMIALLATVLQAILFLVAFYHVYVSAPVLRERSRRTIVLFIAGCIGFSYILPFLSALFIRHFVAEARYIPSGAMLPTLQINDRLFVNKLIYRFSTPERGDIVVFNPTQELKAQNFHDTFIKRIIGLPGEVIEVKDGKVFVNGQVLKETYTLDRTNYSKTFTPVPPNSYLVLGDNRNNSYDSHYWGFLPRENIIGKATKRFYPFDRAGSIIEE
jgi:signal peptidase I